MVNENVPIMIEIPYVPKEEKTIETLPAAMIPDVPTDRKYTIGIEEAARYYGIGERKLRAIVADNPSADFYLEIGRKILLKRTQFERYLDTATAL